MPRILHIDPRVPTLHGVVIPREAVDEHMRAYTTVREARAHARRIIKNSQLMATSLEQQAMREGFQAGWLDSLNAVYNALAEKDHFFRYIEMSLKESVKHALEAAMQKPDLELQLLDAWLASSPRGTKNLQIILPSHAGAQSEAIKRRVTEAIGIEPSVSLGESNSVVIQSGEQVFEFSPQRAMADLSNLAQQCFHRLEVKKETANWTAEIVQYWLSDLRHRFGGELVANYGIDADFDDEFFNDFEDVSAQQINRDDTQ
jgi:hypothetical protein